MRYVGAVAGGVARVGDSIGAIGDVAKDQETLNKRLGELIQGRPEQR